MVDLLDQGVILIPFSEDEQDKSEESMDGPMVRAENDLREGPLFRFRAYRKAWDECLERIEIILLRLQKPVVEEVVRYIYESVFQREDHLFVLAPEMMIVVISCPDRSFAHTSVDYICKTLTMSEHEDIDDKLPRAFISQIHETDCTSLAAMIKALISGFQNYDHDKKLKLKSPSDIQVLSPWIEDVKNEYDSGVLMIVLLPDIGLVQPTFLADFFDLCYCHISEIPLTMLTTASDSGYLHRILPRSTLAKLRLQNFSLACDRQVFEHVIEETFFSPEYAPCLMIGPAGLEMIVSECSRNNAILDSLLSNIQILFLQHFYNPLSLLCVSRFDPILSTVLQNTEDNSIWMPFMKLVRLKLLSEDTAGPAWSDFLPSMVLQKAIEGRKAFHTKMCHAKVALRLWSIIVKFCRVRGLKLKDTSLLETGLKAMRVEMGDIIADIATASLELLDRVQTEALLEEVSYFVNRLPSTLRNLTTGLRGQIAAMKKSLDKSGPFSDFLSRYFRATLTSFDDIPLLDVWQTSDDTLPNSPFNPSVHVSIVTSLLEPRDYLRWGASYETTDARSLPDVSLAFQRYVDSGRMINLYDWYQTFLIAFEAHDQDGDDSMDVEDTPSKSHNHKPSRLMRQTKQSQNKAEADTADKRELQARFMRTVHELEFAGFLKRTGRRTEHVVKTIFDITE